jgi:predicted tellurium resistance membrane protein TerC
MTPEADAAPRRLTAGWLVLLAVTAVLGVIVPPAAVVLAAVCAGLAHAQRQPALRTAFVILAVVFAVLTLVIGTTLVSTGGGESATGG